MFWLLEKKLTKDLGFPPKPSISFNFFIKTLDFDGTTASWVPI